MIRVGEFQAVGHAGFVAVDEDTKTIHVVSESASRLASSEACRLGSLLLMAAEKCSPALARMPQDYPHLHPTHEASRESVDLVRALLESLVWASGSDDFQKPNGKAREGWEKGPAQVIERAQTFLKGR